MRLPTQSESVKPERTKPENRSASQEKARLRILNHLSGPGHYVTADPFNADRMVLIDGSRQPSLVRGSVQASIVLHLQSEGAVGPERRGSGRLILADAGRALLRRLMAQASAENGFQAQHQELRTGSAEEAVIRGLSINDAESPLAWLRRRRHHDGSPMLDETRFIAGERLRADMTCAQMLPRVTSNWTSAVASTARGACMLDPTDGMVAARQRVNRALAAAGPDLAGVLIDVCGFLKGLSDVERERHWPARSGKVVLDIALGRLAAFYGLSQAAVGRGPAQQRIVSWMVESVPDQADSQPMAEAAS